LENPHEPGLAATEHAEIGSVAHGSACDTLCSDMDFRNWNFLATVGSSRRIITPHGRSDMSRRIKPTLMLLLCFLTALNLGGFILNVSSPSRAAVAGMSYQDLVRDPDFTRAVQSIAQECRVNVDLAKLVCMPQR
jgi:hypothetical protein